MEPKKIQSMIRRIKKDQSTLSCMGGMLLGLEFETMSIEDLTTLTLALASKGIQYKQLDLIVARRVQPKAAL